ncbi:MAG: transposase, partial [bacterium]
MRRVAPSTMVHEEIGELLAGGVAPRWTSCRSSRSSACATSCSRGSSRSRPITWVGRYERGAGTRGRRNGYQDATLRTAEGGIGVRVPQVRDGEVPYRSKLLEFLAANSEALDRLVEEMYARGLSTRDIEDCFRGPDAELLISH